MTTVGAESPHPAPPGPPAPFPPYRVPRPPRTWHDGPFTPERPRASWGARVLAVLLDSAIVASVVWFATGASVGALLTLPVWGGGDDPLPEQAWRWTAGTMIALALLQAYTGMTPGKRAAGIAVVDAGSGRPIGVLGTVVRWLAHFLDAIFMFGYLRAAWHPEGRTFADSLLGTVAVRSTRPRPHPWVAWLRRVAPGLRWPSRITSVAALVVCALAAAACLVTGGGSTTGAPGTATCHGSGPVAATAFVESSVTERYESRLGVRREESSWQVVVGWDTAFEVGREGSRNPDDVDTSLTVRSPDGALLEASIDPATGAEVGDVPEGEAYLSSSPEEPIGQEVGVGSTQDLAGWTARTALTDPDTGQVLAECSVPVPAAGPPSDTW